MGTELVRGSTISARMCDECYTIWGDEITDECPFCHALWEPTNQIKIPKIKLRKDRTS